MAHLQETHARYQKAVHTQVHSTLAYPVGERCTMLTALTHQFSRLALQHCLLHRKITAANATPVRLLTKHQYAPMLYILTAVATSMA